jgi:hypothetical protein
MKNFTFAVKIIEFYHLYPIFRNAVIIPIPNVCKGIPNTFMKFYRIEEKRK